MGIELIDVVEQTTRHAEEVHREVRRLATQAFEKRCQTPVIVYTNWLHGDRRPDRSVTADRLARLVQSQLPATMPDDQVWINVDWEAPRRHELDEVLSGVTVVCWTKKTYNEWFATEVGYVHTDPADIQQLLDKKEERLSSYRKNCNEAWLLIYFLGNRISGSAEISPVVRAASYHSAFDRVFLFDFFRNDVAEPAISRPQPSP